MKLKSLHIKGFKSFANETNLYFNKEIIGIVGPNGSGKSNIVDSIRWVLGEQKSKGLRLDKMIDVIFNGTKSKRKATMAQVSMTFENSEKLIPLEYDEVKVTRTLYDNNESEYRINGTLCRLRDIRNLFLDTGIGSNSYAIIELGMVDDILMDKDNARRKMFEQAAGIAKYKVRKHEALNKLKSTQLDLDRIEDILFELQSNLKTFERQAKRTKKYYELKEEHKDLSIKAAHIGQKDAIIKEQEIKSQLMIANEAYNSTNAQIHELEADLEKSKKQNLDSEQLLSEKQKGFNEIIEKIRTSENQKEIKIQNQTFLQSNLNRSISNKNEFDTNIEEINQTLSEKRAALNSKMDRESQLKESYEEWKAKFDQIEEQRKKIQGENTTVLDELKILESKRFELEKSIIEITSKAENADQNNKVAAEEISIFELAQVGLFADQSKFQEELNLINEEIATLIEQKETINKQKRELHHKLEAQKENLQIQNRQLDSYTNEFKLLKDMVDNLEGFPESAKFLTKEWNEIKPILSDVIECQDEYRSAIESFLDPYLSYFVLDSVQEARESIDLLKSAQKGKSQFFILESFRRENLHDVNLSQFGKAAINVVRVAPKYEALLHHLLKDVVIVDDSQILLQQLPDDSLNYISSSGSTNRTKHTIGGGSLGLFDGKRIGRKQEIEKLKTRIDQTNKEVAHLKSVIESLHKESERLESTNFENEIEQKQNLRLQAEKRKVEIDTKIYNSNNAINSLKERIDSFVSSMSDDGALIQEYRSQLVEISDIINAKSDESKNQTGIIEEISKNYGDINSKYNEIQLDYVKHQNEVQNIENDIVFREKQIEDLSLKSQNLNEEISNLKEQISQNNLEIDRLKEVLFTDYKIKEEKQKDLSDTEQDFFANRSIITEKEDRLKESSKKLQTQQIKINDIKDSLTGIEFELRSAIERLKIEFNININDLSVELESEEPEYLLGIAERHEKIKKRLNNYGEINPMAVEAYDEILERFEAMETQRNDILEARDSLLETISEIDKDATDKFLEAFYKVKENFKEVFRSLFSAEDDCDLILFNPDSPLESDIEIVAKPKGKKPKVLSQLSGGEKTLTATALLFSLYLLKPAPFCIFDEVDAPLDDINIQKFSKLIRRFSDASQFIVITHNKSTMAAMDTLYGVYMQEQGVSGISQVDFREYEHDEVFNTVNLN
mgnify:CR=1 FL=1